MGWKERNNRYGDDLSGKLDILAVKEHQGVDKDPILLITLNRLIVGLC